MQNRFYTGFTIFRPNPHTCLTAAWSVLQVKHDSGACQGLRVTTGAQAAGFHRTTIKHTDMKNYTLIVALALALPVGVANAQSTDERPPGPPPGGPGRDGRSPIPPIIAALDKNHDGVISEDEIASAAESLRTLDKNHDGKLTLDELMPPPPYRPMRGDGDRPPGPPSDGVRDGRQRGDFAPPPGAPRDGDTPGHFAPPPAPPRGDASRGNPAPRFERFAENSGRPVPPPMPLPPPSRDGARREFMAPPPEVARENVSRERPISPRVDRYAGNRDGFVPLPTPPRDIPFPAPGFPRDGEIRERAMAARDAAARHEFDRPPDRLPREHMDPRPELRREGFVPPFPPPRNGEPRRDSGRPRDEARPDAGPRGERPPAASPRPDSEPHPNPEG